MSNHADFKVKHGLVVNTTASFLSTVTAISTTTGGVQISGGVGIAKDVYIGGILNIVNATSATNTTSGALQVVGGAGFQGDIYARNIYSNGQLIGVTSNTATYLAGGIALQIPYQTSPGITSFILPPPGGATSSVLNYSTSTGFTWTNATALSSNVSVTSTLDQFTSSGTTATYSLSVTPQAVDKVTVVVDGVTQMHYTYSIVGNLLTLGGIPPAGSKIDVITLIQYGYNIIAPGGTQGQLQYNNNNVITGTPYITYNSTTNVISFTTTTNATSTLTGAVVVSGGMGIGGNLYVGGEIFANRITVQLTTVTTTLVTTDDIISTYNTTPTNSTTTGALQIGGGAGIAGGLFVGGIVTATNMFIGPWVVNTGTVNSSTLMTTAVNLAGGTAGQVPYQSAANTTVFFGPGTAGQFLQSNGASAPSYVNTSAMYVGNSAKVDTVSQTSSASYYLTFVDSNNASANSEAHYTTSSVRTNPSTGWLTADVFESNNNGNGTNFKVGDDAWIGDINTANTFRVTGQQSASNGYIVFGNGDTTSLGRSGTGPLTYGGNTIVHGGNTSTTYVGRAVIADTAAGGSAQVNTVAQTNSASYFLTFVDSNNAVSTAENIYSTSSFTINPATGVVTVASGFTVAKNGTDSLITFPAQTNDPGYIKHYESANTSVMYFNVSDDANDEFNFGYTVAPSTFRLRSDGVILAGTWQGSSISTTYTDAKVVSVSTGTGLYGTTSTGAVSLSLNTSTLMLTAINLNGGAAGSLPYQTGAGVTTFLGIGTSGYVLTSNGSAPVWTASSSISAGQVNVVSQPVAGTYYPVFVDSNNSSATAESVYTTSTFAINPSTGQVGISTSFLSTSSKLTVNGRIESLTDASGEGGQIVLRGKTWYRWSMDNYQDTFRIIREDDVTEANGVAALTITSGTVAAMVLGGSNTVSGERLNVQGGVFVNGILTATSIFVNGYAVSTASALTIQGNGVGLGNAGTLNFTTGTVVTVSSNVATIWANTNTLVTTAVNLNGGTAGQVPYQTAAGATSFFGPGTSGQILLSGGTSAPIYTNTASVYVGASTNAVNLFGGTPGQLHYQSAANTTAFLSTGTQGFILVSQPGAPVYTNTATFLVGYSNNITGGATGSILYQSGANATTSLPISATTGALLASNGSTPYYNNTVTAIVNGVGSASGNTGQTLRVTAGGLGVTGDSYFTNNIGIGGTTTFNGPVIFNGTATYALSTNTYYTDNILELHVPPAGVNAPWFVDDGKDIGFRFHYYTASTDTNAALVLANDTKWLEWYSAGAEGTSTFVGSAYGNFKTGGIWATTGAGVGYTSSQIGEKFGVNGGAYINGIVTATTFVGNLTGLATTATNLAGGSAGVLPFQSAAGVTSFTLAGTIGQFLQSMGTASPVWMSTASMYVGNAVVATNIRAGVAGQLHYQSAADTTGFINTATTGNFLQANYNGAPTWTGTGSMYVYRATLADGLLSGSTGTTQVGYAVNLLGGTPGQIVYQSAANTTAFLSTGTPGQLLMAAVGAPVFTNTSSIYVAAASSAVNLFGGTPGQLHYQSAAGTTAFLSTGTPGQLLMAAVGAPVFTSTGSIYVSRSVSADNLTAGLAGSLPYQTAAGATTMLNIGTNGYVLTSNGTAPTWTSLSGLSAGSATTATNIANGGAGQLVYQIAPGSTGFVGTATYGQFLMGTGASAPVFQSTLTQSNGNIIITSNTAATSTSSGALQVVNGGAGIGGNLYVGGNETVSGTLTVGSGAATISSTGNITFVTTGSIITTATVLINNFTSTTSTNTGALQVSGGIGINGGGFFGGVVTATNLFVGPWAVSTASALTIQGFGTTLGTAGTINFATGTTATLVGGVVTIQATGGGGTSISAPTSTVFNITEQVVTTTATTFTVSGGYLVGQLEVFANGISLTAQDFTATNGTTVTVNRARQPGDSMKFVAITSAGLGTNTYFGYINNETTATVAGQTVYTVTNYVPGLVDVYLNGILLNNADYVATTGNTIVLTTGTGIVAGHIVKTKVFGITTASQTLMLTGGTVGGNLVVNSITPSTSTSTGSVVVYGGVGIGGAINVGSTATFGNVSILNYSVTTNSTSAGQVLAAIDATVYRSAKVVIQASDSTGGKYHTTEILCIHNGTTADHTEYASVNIGGVCGTFTVDYSAGNIRILTTPASSNSTLFRIAAEQIKL